MLDFDSNPPLAPPLRTPLIPPPPRVAAYRRGQIIIEYANRGMPITGSPHGSESPEGEARARTAKSPRSHASPSRRKNSPRCR